MHAIFLIDPSIADESGPRGMGNRLLRIGGWFLKAKYTHGSLVCVVNRSSEVLMVQQRFREPGCWGFPGGFLNLRESPRRAAARELAEEVGISINEERLRLIDEYKQPWAWHYDHLYLVEIDEWQSEAVSSHEVEEIRWFSLEAAPPALTAAARHALRRLASLNALGA